MVQSTVAKIRSFIRDEDAAVTVEFVIALPLLLAMMVFSVQYGNAIRVRNSLDSATRDAARYLARTPLDSSGALNPYFIGRANQIVADRLGEKANNIFLSSQVSDASANVTIRADVPFPLLRMTGFYDPGEDYIRMNSEQFWVRTGTAVVTSSGGGE